MREHTWGYLILVVAAALMLLSIPTVAENGEDPTETVTATPTFTSGPGHYAYLPLVIRGARTATATPTPTQSLATTPTATPTATPTRPIPSKCYISQLSYTGAEEYIAITNPLGAPQDLSGWKIQSVRGDQWYHFPSGYVLGAGGTVYVTSGRDARSDPPLYLRWTGAYIWNDEGDRANLIDSAEQRVDTWGYRGY